MSNMDAIQNSIHHLSTKEFLKRCEAWMEVKPARHHNVHVAPSTSQTFPHQARRAEIQN